MAGTVSADWAWFPRDLLSSIVDRVVEVSDFIRFRSVCKPWCAIAHQCPRHQQLFHLLKTSGSQLPMLLFSTNENTDDNRCLYSITERATYQIQMPIPCNRRFCGSSQGWLFMVDKSMNITLVNPFLNKIVVLPQFKVPDKEYWFQYKEYDDHDYFIKKAILLPETFQNKGDGDFKVLLTYGGMNKLAYLKSRDVPWKCIVPPASNKEQVALSDIICYKGQVYAVCFYSALVLVDVMTGGCKIIIDATNVFAQTTYIVESHYGNLLLVRRFLDWPNDEDNNHRTEKFEVFKLSWGQAENPKWVKLKRIGKQALFLGANYSICISTRDFSQCKSNCIYYVDDYLDILNAYIPRVDDDSGIYNMEDKSFSRSYAPDPSFCSSLPPIWIVPTLRKVNDIAFNLTCAKID